jgi:hypothetical protein
MILFMNYQDGWLLGRSVHKRGAAAKIQRHNSLQYFLTEFLDHPAAAGAEMGTCWGKRAALAAETSGTNRHIVHRHTWFGRARPD